MRRPGGRCGSRARRAARGADRGRAECAGWQSAGLERLVRRRRPEQGCEPTANVLAVLGIEAQGIAECCTCCSGSALVNVKCRYTAAGETGKVPRHGE